MGDWIDNEFDKRDRDEARRAYRREVFPGIAQATWERIVSVLKQDVPKLSARLGSKITITDNSSVEITIYKRAFPRACDINIKRDAKTIIVRSVVKENPAIEEVDTGMIFTLDLDENDSPLILTADRKPATPEKVSETILRQIIDTPQD